MTWMKNAQRSYLNSGRKRPLTRSSSRYEGDVKADIKDIDFGYSD
jgi:hypothetical protein